MTCNAATSGVGDALAVDHQQVGIVPDPIKGLQESRSLAKGQKAGNIGKIQFRNHSAFLDDSQIGEAHHHHARKSPRRIFSYRHIGTGHKANRFEMIFLNDFGRELFLNLNGFFWGEVPGM